MSTKVKTILDNQSGMQVLETIGLAVVGLIAVAVIFNLTKGGFNSASNKMTTTIQSVNNKL